MSTTPRIRVREEHRQLRQKLQQDKWSVAELEWLAAHAQWWPADLTSLLQIKLKDARQEAARAHIHDPTHA